jgi:hypothetical protein
LTISYVTDGFVLNCRVSNLLLNKLNKYVFVFYEVYIEIARPNEDAKRLLDDLFSDYDPVVRPVKNPEDTIKLSIGLKLSQIADIVRRHFFVLLEYLISVLKQQFYFLFDKDEKNQIMVKYLKKIQSFEMIEQKFTHYFFAFRQQMFGLDM